MIDPPQPPTIDRDPAAELTASFAETARALFSAGGVTNTLQLVVDLAEATVEGCDYAGIFLREGDAIVTPVQTDPLVIEIDRLQKETGEGPCLDAVERGETYYAGDLSDEPRWGRFGPLATALGVRSLLALSMPSNGTPGALNLYARYPQAFGAVDRARALILASLAGVAVSSARSHEDEERRADNLHAALATREIIGQAQGILMERERISAEQAFDILRRASQHLNRKLGDIAKDLVDTGERPATGPSDASG